MRLMERSMGALGNDAEVRSWKGLEGFSLQMQTEPGKNQEKLLVIDRICAIMLLEKILKQEQMCRVEGTKS